MIYLVVLLLCFVIGLNAQVNGILTQNNGKWILKTWGTHQERGYAQGYLLSQPIMQIINTYMYQTVAMSDSAVYNDLLNFYLSHFEVETKYQQEATGIINGLAASGTNIYLAGLQRNINSADILTANCLVDLYFYQSQITGSSNLELNCASISSWGSSTQADAFLQGNVVITRFMDWNQDGSLIANPLLMVSHPTEAGEQDWISFTYPGMIGALSAISASGKAAFLNTGNIHDTNNLNGLHPILLSIRNGIEAQDYNNDGADNITDIYQAIDDQLSLSGTLVHAVSENPVTMTGIIEANNNLGTVMRTSAQNDNLPPGTHLVATNHFRLLNPPVCCTRYGNIVDSLTTNPVISAKRQLSLLIGAAGLQNNMMSMQYEPSSGRLLWSTATLSQPAFQNEMSILNRTELFSLPNSNQDETSALQPIGLNVYPNPAQLNSTVKISSKTRIVASLEVYNLKGQKIAIIHSEKGEFKLITHTAGNEEFSAGIYLLMTKGINGQRMVSKLLLLN